jgi:hypothetical protein
MGLWLLAGTWCAANLTDGSVPAYLPEEVGVPKRFAASLVTSGLWLPADDGWQFAEWAPRQKTRAQVLAERDAKRAAGAAGGRASGRSRRSKMQPETKQGASPVVADSFGGSELQVQLQSQLQSQPTTPLVALVCRRLSGGTRDTTTDDELDLWRETAGPGVDLDTELRMWLVRNADTDLDDPGAALLGWLRRAAERTAPAAVPAPAPCPEPGCVGGWLGEDPEDGRPIPCPACRSNVRSLRGAS